MSKNIEIKRLFSSFLVAVFLLSQSLPSFAENQAALVGIERSGKAIQGGVDYSELDENKDLFTGQIEAVQKGAKLKMTVSSVVSSGFHIKGDEFFAEVTDDFSTQSGIVIPSGTVAHGTVTELKDKKYPSSVLTSIGILFISDRKEPKSNPETQTASIDSTSDISSKSAMTYTLTNHTYTAQRLDDSYSDDTQADS